MALETLKDIKDIGGFDLTHYETNEWYEAKQNSFINVDKYDSVISFKIQNGPIKEVGVNGCQVDTLIKAAFLMLYGLHEKFPCGENEDALYHLKEAGLALRARKKDREKRGVEGFNKE